MTVAFWCVLVALLLPYLLSVLARSGVSKADYVRDPRAFNETLTGWHRRGHLAQLNAFETFPAFAAAVVIAHLAGVSPGRSDATALLFVGVRILHAACYLADRPSLRSAAWQAGMLCIVALFVFAALAGPHRRAPAFLTSPATRALDLPFSDAVRAGDVLYVSGQLGTRPGTLALVPGGIRAEAAQALENVRAILEANGSRLAAVVKCTVFLDDIAEWPAFNEVYRRFFPHDPPARSALGAAGLALGAAVEVECLAVTGPGAD